MNRRLSILILGFGAVLTSILIFRENVYGGMSVFVERPITYDCQKVDSKELSSWEEKGYREVGGCKDNLLIRNPQSFPEVGGEWIVYFSTTGHDRLSISPDTFSQYGKTLQFEGLYCGGEEVAVEHENGNLSVDWNCKEEGRLVNTVLTSGKHTLAFSFADETEIARNCTEGTCYNNTICLDNNYTTFIYKDWYVNGTCNIGSMTLSSQANIYVQNADVLNLTGSSDIVFYGSNRYLFTYSGGTTYLDDTAGINKKQRGSVTDFTSNPGVTNLANTVYKVYDFTTISPNSTGYALEYDWMSTNYYSQKYGFCEYVMVCNTSSCSQSSHDVVGLHCPDTDSGYTYGMYAAGGGTESGRWGSPSTNRWYNVKIVRQANGTSTYTIRDKYTGTIVHSSSFGSGSWSTVNRIAVSAWTLSWQGHNVYWDSGAQNIYIHYWRTDTTSYDYVRLDNIRIYPLQ